MNSLRFSSFIFFLILFKNKKNMQPRLRIVPTLAKGVDLVPANVGFTTVNLGMLVLAACSKFKWKALSGIVTCSSWGVCVSFHSALLFDRTCFHRMAQRRGMSMRAFHVANVVVHILPCVVCVHMMPLWWHGLLASSLHVSWGLLQSRGTMRLDETYVAMRKRVWYWLWVVAIVTECLTPFYNSSTQTGLAAWKPASECH